MEDRSQVFDKIRGVIIMGYSEDEKYDHSLCIVSMVGATERNLYMQHEIHR